MNTLRLRAIRILGSLIVVLLGACGGGGGSAPPAPGSGNPPPAPDGGGSDTIAPSVVGTAPLDAATGVAFNAVISATLSEAIDPATVTPTSLSVQQGATAIPGSVAASGASVSFQPDVALRSGLTYTATLDAGVTDLTGNPLGTDHSWQFTVAAYNLAFVTSVSGNGNLGSWADAGGDTGLAAGDAICQARAAAAGLSDAANFRAWLSDDDDDAYCRIHNLTGKRSANCGQTTLPASAGPWVRTDGFPFGAGITELLDNGKVFTPARFDEFGAPVAGDSYFTGTFIDGSLRGPQFQAPDSETCTNWTSNSASLFAASGGDAQGTAGDWSSFWSSDCAISARLLCMHAGAGPALPALVPSGKKVFLTSTFGTGNLGSWAGAGGNAGLAAGDAICQAHATAAGLANAANFKAWLSDSTVDAKDRITSNGPWVRLDGVPVADDKADLLDGSLFTSINVDENGVYWLGFGVWSGTTDSGVKSPLTCNAWSDATSGFTGASARATSAGAFWSDRFASTCDNTLFKLRCFED